MAPQPLDRRPVVQPGTEAEPSAWSLPLGRVAGISVKVHLSFLVLVALVAAASAAADEPVLPALGWLVVLFACVVVHELAHSLVARRRGTVVREIDLLPIGGVSRMESLPERWQDEAAIAAAGPLASLGLAVWAGLAAVASGVDLLSGTPWDGPLIARLAWVNLLLAAFNMLPAFPLDGGRVLRALLERDRSRLAATRLAARLGRVLAAVLVVVGLTANVWLLVIGVFVWWAGRAEERAVLLHDVLGPVPVERLAVPCPLVLAAEARVADVLPGIRSRPQVAYPVADHERVVGVAPLGTLLAAPTGARVGSLATGVTAPAGTSVEDVAAAGEGGHPVTVVDRRGAVVGVLTPEVLATYLQEAAAEPG